MLENFRANVLKSMLHRAYRFSSSWESVVRECKYLEGMSFKLGYPDRPLPRFKSQSLWRNMKFRRTTPCRRETSFGSYYLSKIRDLRTSSENSSKISNTIQYKLYLRVQKLVSNFKCRRENHLPLVSNVLYINGSISATLLVISISVGTLVKSCHGFSYPYFKEMSRKA